MDGRLDLALALGPIYDDGTYLYFGEAHVGTALNAGHWRVSRMNKTTKRVEWAEVTNDKESFTNVFTDLTTVAAFTYS